MWIMMHAKQSYLNRVGIIVFWNRKEDTPLYHIFKLIILLFGSIMMFDSGMFLRSFDTDYIGWKHLHTTLYGSAAGCRSIQKMCSLKAWIDFQKHTKSVDIFLQIKHQPNIGGVMIWGVRIAIFTEIRHLVEELITFLSILDFRNGVFWQLD